MECHRRVCHLKDHGASFRHMFSEENNGVSPPRCHLKDHGVSFRRMFSEGKPWSVTAAFAN